MTMPSALGDTAIVAERRDSPRSSSKTLWSICAFEPVVMRLRADYASHPFLEIRNRSLIGN